MGTDRLVQRAMRKTIDPTASQCGIVVLGSFSRVRGYVPRGGWTAVGATVDRRLVGTVDQSDVWPLAVALPPGRHEVELRARRAEPELTRRLHLSPGEVWLFRFRAPRRRLFRGVSAPTWSVTVVRQPHA